MKNFPCSQKKVLTRRVASTSSSARTMTSHSRLSSQPGRKKLLKLWGMSNPTYLRYLIFILLSKKVRKKVGRKGIWGSLACSMISFFLTLLSMMRFLYPIKEYWLRGLQWCLSLISSMQGWNISTSNSQALQVSAQTGPTQLAQVTATTWSLSTLLKRNSFREFSLETTLKRSQSVTLTSQIPTTCLFWSRTKKPTSCTWLT